MKRIPWKLLLWLVGLGPLLGLAGLVGLARMGDLPETEALANPKTDFATRVYSFDGKVLGGITPRTVQTPASKPCRPTSSRP